MNFFENIKNLLLFNGRVTFPGLGSLELVKESARVKGKMITPPGSVVVFNPDISFDDGKLAQSIASAGDTDIEEAKQGVLELVDKMLFSLNKGESFIFEGVGTLFKDENNVIRFENDPVFIPDYNSFGLESFELEAVEEKITKETLISEDDAKSNVLSPEENPVPVFQEPTNTISDTMKAGKRKRSGILLSIFTALTFLIAVLFILWCRTGILDNAYYSIFGTSEKEPVNILTGDKSLPSEDLEKTTDLQMKADEAEKEITPPVSKYPADASGYREFHIIAGSFRDTINAQLLARELTILGYPVMIIEQPNSLYRVSAMSFKDKESGLKELSRFRGKTKNNAAWLLELGD